MAADMAGVVAVDPVLNPYSPGAGRPPAALVGRERQSQAWRVSLARVEARRTAQPVVLYGLRGVGKTVLLSAFAKMAVDREWIVAQVEAGAGKSLREALGEALHGPLADLARPSAGKRLLKGLKTALSFKASYDLGGTWNFGLDLANTAGGGADTGMLETDLGKLVRDLSGAAEEEGVGLAILIDEAQDLSEAELTAVCSAAHVAGQDGWSCLFALAGLPSLPRVLAEAASVRVPVAALLLLAVAACGSGSDERGALRVRIGGIIEVGFDTSSLGVQEAVAQSCNLEAVEAPRTLEPNRRWYRDPGGAARAVLVECARKEAHVLSVGLPL